MILLLVFLWGGGGSPPSAIAQVYPSTATGWVLPGAWQKPLAPAMFKTPDDVKQWEAAHADIIFGSLQDVAKNTQTIALGYMYSQKWDCRPGRQEAWMHRQAMRQGFDPENMYLHYGEDTVLKVPVINSGMAALLNGKPYHLLLVRDGNFSTARLPMRITSADTLFAISAYPSQDVIIDAHATPTVALSQPNTAGDIGQWRSVKMAWQPVNASNSPSAGSAWQGERLDQITWQPALARYQGRMLNSGLKALDDGLPVWVMALSWPVDGTVHAVTFQPWITTKGDAMHFPGWDDRNDQDGDGWVNNQEWGARANTAASARFRHQARVIPAGHMWPNTCWYRTNFTAPAINTLHAQWYRHDWQQQGLSGAYNDDMAKLLGENQFSLLSGGTLIEITHPVGHQHTSMIYAQQMANFLQLVKTTTKTQWLAANISELNLWEYAAWPTAFRNVVDVWLREHYLSPAVGLERLQRKWDSFALAKRDDKSLIMVTTKGGRSSQNPLSPEAWNQDIATGLALYYLFNIPGQTYYHSWNQTFYYGSGNTDVSQDNPTNSTWYRGGVPKNWAYQPSAMLRVAIGSPVNAPAGYPPVYWQSKVDKAPSSHDVIKINQTERVPLNPANWFWLYRSGWWGEFPEEGVIARQYSEGLVVYRATRIHDDPHFFHATPRRVSLPGEYQRVNVDGSLSQPVRHIELKGYEGVVLKRYPSR
ncbi:hypothetical protein ABT56_10560 [Photobacterium aquae]|uniref:Glycosyl hydrolase n=2 Tax=Photobacterium aquae TaxID=1195763 RepID=A0A0J1H2M7_9GAMM|nr:hypothetical protein ABT56_10560 [Photobacterium aquae]